MFVNKRFTKEVYVCKNVRYNEYYVFLNNFNKKFSENPRIPEIVTQQ